MRPDLTLIAVSIPCMIASGVGGQPGTATSTGITFDTRHCAQRVEQARDRAGTARAEDPERPDRQPEQDDADDDFEMGRGKSGHRLSAGAA